MFRFIRILIFIAVLFVVQTAFGKDLSPTTNICEVFNFTKKPIYATISGTKDVLKIPSYKSDKIKYKQDQIQIYVFKSFSQHSSACIVEVSRFFDVFVFSKSDLHCERRAKRVPQEEW